MGPGGLRDVTTLDHLIAEATASGGSERANYQLFISGLCDVLGVPRPAMSQEANARNAKNLEGKHDARDVAEFLMRCLFSMFADQFRAPRQA